MLHRRSSSRRRRASRSGASSPQSKMSMSPQISQNRRASIAVSPVEPSRGLFPDMNRSPRHSMVPDISLSRNSLDSDSDSGTQRISLMPEKLLSPRGSLVPEIALSSRTGLFPERVSRKALTPDSYNRSPRNSLVPDSFNRSPRNSLVPDPNRSHRNSLVPDSNRSPRNSLVPDPSRSPRHSLVPDTFSCRVDVEYNRSPRNSLVPDMSRSPRHSLVPSESSNWNARSPNQEEIPMSGGRSPRHTSPRGSIVPERTSPRESICEYVDERDRNRSPRGSIGPEAHNRSPRGSVGYGEARRGYDSAKSPRGSLSLTFQDPPTNERRYSADNNTGELRHRFSLFGSDVL